MVQMAIGDMLFRYIGLNPRTFFHEFVCGKCLTIHQYRDMPDNGEIECPLCHAILGIDVERKK